MCLPLENRNTRKCLIETGCDIWPMVKDGQSLKQILCCICFLDLILCTPHIHTYLKAILLSDIQREIPSFSGSYILNGIPS